MKTFLQFIAEKEETEEEIRKRLKLDPKEYNFYYRGKWVIDTAHKIEREARGNIEQAQDLFKKAIDWLLDNKKGKGVYLFVSKSTNTAMVIDYRKDKKHRVKGNNLAIVTWLGDITKLKKPKTPKTLKTTTKGDTKIILEFVQENDGIEEINEIIEFT